MITLKIWMESEVIDGEFGRWNYIVRDQISLNFKEDENSQ